MNPADEVAQAVQDADFFGTGWVRVTPTGTVGRYDLERIDPALVVLTYPAGEDIRDRA